jgi:GNAT superfamily N-acetyltransferase
MTSRLLPPVAVPETLPVTIRPATEADAPAIAALLRALGWFAQLAAEDSPATAARVAAHIALCVADASHSLYAAADCNGRVVGYVAAHWLPYLFLPGPEGFVSELFVDAACRGRGIGRQLQDAVVAEARRRGCARLMLVNGRSRESYRRAYYAARGWVEREDVANFVMMLEPPAAAP